METRFSVKTGAQIAGIILSALSLLCMILAVVFSFTDSNFLSVQGSNAATFQIGFIFFTAAAVILLLAAILFRKAKVLLPLSALLLALSQLSPMLLGLTQEQYGYCLKADNVLYYFAMMLPSLILTVLLFLTVFLRKGKERLRDVAMGWCFGTFAATLLTQFTAYVFYYARNSLNTSISSYYICMALQAMFLALFYGAATLLLLSLRSGKPVTNAEKAAVPQELPAQMPPAPVFIPTQVPSYVSAYPQAPAESEWNAAPETEQPAVPAGPAEAAVAAAPVQPDEAPEDAETTMLVQPAEVPEAAESLAPVQPDEAPEDAETTMLVQPAEETVPVQAAAAFREEPSPAPAGRCPRCGRPLTEGALFCGGCGLKLQQQTAAERHCIACGRTIGQGAAFCRYCGTKQG